MQLAVLLIKNSFLFHLISRLKFCLSNVIFGVICLLGNTAHKQRESLRQYGGSQEKV